MPTVNGVLEARGVHVWRGERHVLRGVSFAAGPGEAIHVAGANGAGKTTLLRTLAGFLWPEDGDVLWDGRPVQDDRDGFGADVAYLGHDNALKADFSVRENLHYLVGLRRVLAPARVESTLEQLGLTAHAERAVRTLSAGQRRRAAMARTVLSDARLWLLDEPFTNLDVAGTATMAALIAGHVGGGGTALYTAHGPVELGAPVRRLELS